MRKIYAIFKYEYAMQIKRIAGWGVLLVSLALALLDNFPSSGNLARLEFLTQPAYFVYRTMSLSGPILIFGLLFLVSSRIHMDMKTGIKALFMAAPISKEQYVSGKLMGGFFYTLSMISVFLVLNTITYGVFNPVHAGAMEYIAPLVKTLLIIGIPVSCFISICAITLPAMMDIRLFYLLFSIVFIINAATVGSAGKMPFYLITSGDLLKLIWQHPKYPFYDMKSVMANLFFLLGCGLLAETALLLKRKFWRAE